MRYTIIMKPKVNRKTLKFEPVSVSNSPHRKHPHATIHMWSSFVRHAAFEVHFYYLHCWLLLFCCHIPWPRFLSPKARDQINNSLLGEDLWGCWRWGQRMASCYESWEVVSVASCCLWFSQCVDRISEHSTFDSTPPNTLSEVPQRETWNCFWHGS